MAALERPQLRRDTEQPGDEIFQVRRKVEDELRRVIRGPVTSLQQPLVQWRRGFRKMSQESAVQPDESVAVVKVLKIESKGESKRFCRHDRQGRRIDSPATSMISSEAGSPCSTHPRGLHPRRFLL